MQHVKHTATQELPKQKPLTPPRTSGFPLVGAIPNVLNKQLDYFTDAWETHGDVYELDLGVMSIIILNHPDYAQYVMRDNIRNYTKTGPMWESLQSMIGQGLVTSTGNYWRRQRRLIQPHFHRQHLAGLVDLMIEAIEDGMRDWGQLARAGEPVDMTNLFAKITMKVIVRSMFGRSLNEGDAELMGDAMRYTLDYQLQGMITSNLPDWIPFPGEKTYQAKLEEVDRYIYRMIDERRQSGDAGDDLLSMFLNLADDETGEPLTDKEIRDEVTTIFLAGYETTAIVMTWASYLLTQNPDVMKKLQTEVDEVLQGRMPRFEDVRQLPYALMVMQETMRIYPPAYWLPRTTVKDDVIGGYQIKAGQMVAPMIYMLHRHPDFWEQPETFNPEHFAPDTHHNRHPQAFMPFGAGQRMCIGKDFALMEGALILARLVQQFNLHTVSEHMPQPAIGTTLASKNGIWLSLKAR